MNLAFFASHNGSNMQAVIDACNPGYLNARPCVVIGNNCNSEALARAKREGIAGYQLSSTTHPDPVLLDQAILSILNDHEAIVAQCRLTGIQNGYGCSLASALVG